MGVYFKMNKQKRLEMTYNVSSTYINKTKEFSSKFKRPYIEIMTDTES